MLVPKLVTTLKGYTQPAHSGPLVALIATTAPAPLAHLPLETIGSRFGAVHAGFPTPHLPNLAWGTMRDLIQRVADRPLRTRAPRSDVIVLLLTFFLTVLVDLTVAVEVGILLAAFLFMKRMAEVSNVTALSREFAEVEVGSGALFSEGRDRIPAGVQLYAIDGPFFFGAAEKFKETLGTVAGAPRVIVLLMRQVSAMDSTGLRALLDVMRRFRAGGTALVLVGVHAQPMTVLERAGVIEQVGEENLVGTIDDALARARTLMGA